MPAPIRTIGILAFQEKESTALALAAIARWAKSHPGITFATNCPLPDRGAGPIRACRESWLQSHAGLVLALGGDGTFLTAARLVCGRGIPVLGVNLGRIGFLAEASRGELSPLLDRVARGDYELSERMMLRVEIFHGKKQIFEDVALNEASFTGRMGSELIELEVEAGGEFLTTYRVDGLLVSTPTGSTAYSLSAGGPIVHPGLDSLLLTPINPTSLSVRPVLIPAGERIQVRCFGTKKGAVQVLMDGRHRREVDPGHRVVVSRNPTGLKVMRAGGATFFGALRGKLGWDGSHLPRS